MGEVNEDGVKLAAREVNDSKPSHRYLFFQLP